MLRKFLKLESIPAVLWGGPSEKVVLAVHGNLSSKTDVPIELFAEKAVPKDYQVLSFDLPEHGDRKGEAAPCKVQTCVRDLTAVLEYAKENWKQISLFANSIGAYLSLLACQGEPLEKAWFLSPVVDLQRMIENMMKWFHITEEQLQTEQEISPPAGQKLYWDTYCYVKEHPVARWEVPTAILYGSLDDVCEFDTVQHFANRFCCTLRIAQQTEHYFHTQRDLQELGQWLDDTL